MGTEQVTDAQFEEAVLKSSTPVLVDFWAEWCGPCKALAPKLEELSDELGEKVRVLKLNIEENPQSPAQYQVRGIPTMILFKDGQQVDAIVGNQSKDAIKEVIDKHT